MRRGYSLTRKGGCRPLKHPRHGAGGEKQRRAAPFSELRERKGGTVATWLPKRGRSGAAYKYLGFASRKAELSRRPGKRWKKGWFMGLFQVVKVQFLVNFVQFSVIFEPFSGRFRKDTESGGEKPASTMEGKNKLLSG